MSMDLVLAGMDPVLSGMRVLRLRIAMRDASLRLTVL